MGCLVFAYNVAPLTEYVPLTFLFEPGDILSIAKTMEVVAQSFSTCAEMWENLGQTGRDIALQYSLQMEEKSVIAAWQEILQNHSASLPPLLRQE